jgi:formate dehydrogenase assembly factor FdhD
MNGFQSASSNVPLAVWRDGFFLPEHHEIAEASLIALSCSGLTHVALIARPANFGRFTLGFSLSEDTTKNPSDIGSLDLIAMDGGVEAPIWRKP